jgi:hypothetical protein
MQASAAALMAIVHALDHTATQHAVAAGADGLAHQGSSTPHLSLTSQPPAARRALFVISTLVVLEAISGRGHGPEQARDPRFAAYLDQTSHMTLTMGGGNFPSNRAPTWTLPLRLPRCSNCANPG